MIEGGVSMLACDIVVRKFELQSRYYSHFRTNTSEPPYHPLQLWVK